MPAGTEFLLLGPLVVRIDGTLVRIPAAKHRAVLAALLLRANRVVTVDDLAEALWGEDLPSAARTGVQNYVMRLRKALGPAAARLTTQPGGYLIRLEAGELDLDRFEGMLRDARAAAGEGRWPDAADHASGALALWRGEPLADVGSDLLAAREGPRLTELRLQALETRIDAGMQLERHGEVITELRQLTAEHPLRERLHAQLMLALYRDGQQADALSAYQHAREILVGELGAEPGPDLQRLQQQILTADPALALPAGPVTPGQPPAPVPRELPGDVAAFTGRTAELAELDRLLLGSADAPGERKPTTAVISAVSGTAGVGKTALAVHWAHHAADRFPDGQLHVNLRGYDPDRLVTAAEALAGFLRSLGVAGGQVPAEEPERVARYRSLLADKRMLVVLDNAATVEQVRPLLPGNPECRVLVTSRDSLAGLVARDGARRLDLDLLPLDDAVALLRELIGDPAETDPGAATELAIQCARLPLALRVAAELASGRAHTPLAGLVAELRDEQVRLDLLHADGDPRTAVRAVFSWSYDHLDAESARAFRLAGLHPGADFEPCALAALTGSTIEQTGRTLGTLTRAHLVQAAASGRYALHDLLRAYARDLAAEHEGDTGTHAALTRLFDHYLSATAAATELLFPFDQRPNVGRSDAPAPPLTDPDSARAWLDSERANLVATAVQAAEGSWPQHATALSRLLQRYLFDGGHTAEQVAACTAARQAGRQTGDLAAEAKAVMGLGVACWRQGRYEEAAAHMRAALTLYRKAGDRLGEAGALGNLGNVEMDQGSPARAARHFRRALALYREVGDLSGQSNAIDALARTIDEARHPRRVAALHEESLAICRAIGDKHGQVISLINLGFLERRLERFERAAEYYQQALALARLAGFRRGEAETLSNFGTVERLRGRHAQAVILLRQALDIFTGMEAPGFEADARNELGAALLAAGQPDEAAREYTTALALGSRLGSKREQARAHDGLGNCYHNTGQVSLASQHWRQALELFTELAVPEADQVRDRLAALDNRESLGA